MTTWFTSDLHFGHVHILEYTGRPWNTLHEMHEGLIERWNYHVEQYDTVVIQGDFAMGDRSLNVPYATRLNGNKIFLPGNHDHCWHGGKKTWRDWLDFYGNYFYVITLDPGQLTYEYPLTEDITVELSHFPRVDAKDRYDERYKTWRPPMDGPHWLLHGHTHSKERVRPEARQIHIGVDAWDYAPVALEQIVEIINKG